MRLSRKSVLVTSAVVVLGLGGLACGATGSPSSNAPKVTGSGGPIESAKADGPVMAKVGQMVTLTDGLSGEDEIAFTVKSVKQVKSANDFNQPEKGKVFIGVEITIKVVKGEALMTGNEISLIGPDNEKYNAEPLTVGIKNGFEWTTLKNGQQRTGVIVFQAPKSAVSKGAKIEVNSFWGDSPSAYYAL